MLGWVRGSAFAVVPAAAGCGQGAVAESAQPRSWQPADPGPGGLVQVYAPREGGVTALAVAPNGTVFALAEVAADGGDEVSRALVELSPDGQVQPIDVPDSDEPLVPLCTGTDGSLYAAHRGAVSAAAAGAGGPR